MQRLAVAGFPPLGVLAAVLLVCFSALGVCMFLRPRGGRKRWWGLRGLRPSPLQADAGEHLVQPDRDAGELPARLWPSSLRPGAGEHVAQPDLDARTVELSYLELSDALHPLA